MVSVHMSVSVATRVSVYHGHHNSIPASGWGDGGRVMLINTGLTLLQFNESAADFFGVKLY